jgi:hypothetical protein
LPDLWASPYDHNCARGGKVYEGSLWHWRDIPSHYDWASRKLYRDSADYCERAATIVPKLAGTTVPASGVYRGPWEGGLVCRGEPAGRRPQVIHCATGNATGFQARAYQPWAPCPLTTAADGRVWKLLFDGLRCGEARYLVAQYHRVRVPSSGAMPVLPNPTYKDGLTPIRCSGAPRGETPLKLVCDGIGLAQGDWLIAAVTRASTRIRDTAKQRSKIEAKRKPNPKTVIAGQAKPGKATASKAEAAASRREGETP